MATSQLYRTFPHATFSVIFCSFFVSFEVLSNRRTTYNVLRLNPQSDSPPSLPHHTLPPPPTTTTCTSPAMILSPLGTTSCHPLPPYPSPLTSHCNSPHGSPHEMMDSTQTSHCAEWRGHTSHCAEWGGHTSHFAEWGGQDIPLTV